MKTTKQRLNDIVKLISTRIPDVGFGKMDEEDFDAVKVELEDDGLADGQELSLLSFQKWQELKEARNTMKLTKERLRQIIDEELHKLTEVESVTEAQSAPMLAADVKLALQKLLDSETALKKDDYTTLSWEHRDILGEILSWLEPLVKKERIEDIRSGAQEDAEGVEPIRLRNLSPKEQRRMQRIGAGTRYPRTNETKEPKQ